jgi:hypothetical protein
VKRTPIFTRRRQQRDAAVAPVNEAPSRPARHGPWRVVPDVEEGPDTAFREVMRRIARGDRIRGHAL